MMHVRQQIVDAAKAILSTAPTNWNIAFASRWPPPRDLLPYLMVYAGSETIEPETIHPGHIQARSIDLTVVGRSRIVDGEEQEKAIAAIQEEIEQTLTTEAMRNSVPKVKGLQLQSVTSGDGEDENERSFVEIIMEWRVLLFTAEGYPGNLL